MEINTKYYLGIDNYRCTTLNRSECTKSNPFSIPFEHYSQTGVDENLLFSSQPNLLNTYKTDETFISDKKNTGFLRYQFDAKEATIIDEYKKNELKHLEIPEIVATLYKALYQHLSDKSLPEVKEIEKNINLLLEEYNNTNQNTTSIKLKIEYELFKLSRIADANGENLNPFLTIFDKDIDVNYTLSLINADTIGDFLNFSSDLDVTFNYWINNRDTTEPLGEKNIAKCLEYVSKVLLQKAKENGIDTSKIAKQIKAEIKRYKKASSNQRVFTSTNDVNKLFRTLYSQIAEKEGLEPLQNYEYLTQMHKLIEPLYDDASYQNWQAKYLNGFLKDYKNKNYDEKFIEEMFIYFKNNNPSGIDEINKIEEKVKTYLNKYKNNDGDKTEIDAIICFEILKLRNIGKECKESPFLIIDFSHNITPFINNHTIGEFLNLSNDMDLVLNNLLPYNEDYTTLFNKIEAVLIDMANKVGIDTTDISKQIEAAISEYKNNINPDNKENKPTTNKISELFRTLYSQIAQKNNLPQLDNSRYNNLIPAAVKELETTYLFDVLNKYIDIKNKEEVKDFLLKIFDYQTNKNKDINDLRESYILVIEKINREIESNSSDIKFWVNYYGSDLLDKIRRTWERKNIPNTPNIEINQNGLVDRDFQQGSVGSCWLLASIKSLASNPQTAKMLNNNITIDEAGNTHVKLLGPNKTYIVTREELLSHSDYSTGDYDIRAIEIAVNKYLLEERKEDVEGGTHIDAMNILLGNSIVCVNNAGKTNLMSRRDRTFENLIKDRIIEKLPELIENKHLIWGMGLNITASQNIRGEIVGENNTITLGTGHAYGVVNIDKDYIYLSNPHDSKEIIKVLLKDIIDGQGTLIILETKDSNIIKGIIIEAYIEAIKKGEETYSFYKRHGICKGSIEEYEELCASAAKFLEDNRDTKGLKTFELSSLLILINPPEYTEEEQKEIFTQIPKEFHQQTYGNSPFAQYMNIMN